MKTFIFYLYWYIIKKKHLIVRPCIVLKFASLDSPVYMDLIIKIQQFWISHVSVYIAELMVIIQIHNSYHAYAYNTKNI